MGRTRKIRMRFSPLWAPEARAQVTPSALPPTPKCARARASLTLECWAVASSTWQTNEFARQPMRVPPYARAVAAVAAALRGPGPVKSHVRDAPWLAHTGPASQPCPLSLLRVRCMPRFASLWFIATVASCSRSVSRRKDCPHKKTSTTSCPTRLGWAVQVSCRADLLTHTRRCFQDSREVQVGGSGWKHGARGCKEGGCGWKHFKSPACDGAC